MDDETLTHLLSEKGLERADKILLCLFSLPRPAKVKSVREKAVACGLRPAAKWNISQILGNFPQYAVLVKGGWNLLPAGIHHLKPKSGKIQAPYVSVIEHNLHRHLKSLSDPKRKNFLQEAVRCFDEKLYRAAIVLSWSGATHVLRELCFDNRAAFNAAGKSRFPKNFKPVVSFNDFERIKESDLLQLTEDAKLIGKTEKQELLARLQQRNAAGHPNTLRLTEAMCAAHLESLLENVFEKF